MVLQDDHAPFTGAKLYLWAFGCFTSPLPFPCGSGGGGVSTPKVPSSCLDLGPVVRDRVRFAAMSKTWNILLSGYHNLGFYKVCSPSGMLVGHCSPNA